MKAVILAAGFGSEMKPLSELIPKPLMPVANRPIIEHQIRNLQNVNVSEIILLVGHLSNQIIKFFEQIDIRSLQIKIIKAKNYEKGPIHTFNNIRNLNFKEDFILSPCDLFSNSEIISLLVQHHKNGSISVPTDSSKRINNSTYAYIYSESRLKSQNEVIKFGKVAGFKNRVINKSGTSVTVIPIIICTPLIFDFVEDAIAQNEINLTSALNSYIEKLHPINYFDFSGYYWFDIDNLNDLLDVNRFALDNNIIPANHFSPTKGGKIIDLKLPLKNSFHPTTELIPPIIIGNNCYTKKNSCIGPYVSLSNNSGVEANSIIKNSIIYEDSRVPEDSKIENAIIFKNKILKV